MMNDPYVWGAIVAAVFALAWLMWPKGEKNETAQLDPVKPADPAPEPVVAIPTEIGRAHV